jgi:hypothetical protein
MEQYEKILSLVLQTSFTILLFTIVVAIMFSIYQNFKNK